MIALVGFMGAGKSTVGRLVASRLGLPFVDADDVIESRAGEPIADIFAARGERFFRALERDVVSEILEGPAAVVAFGGGALGDPATCAALGWATVVLLEVGYAEAMRRVGPDPRRPLLAAADPRALFLERESLCRRLADITVATDGRHPDDVAAEVAARAAPAVATEGVDRVVVAVPGAAYKVVVGGGASRRSGELIPLPPDAEVAVVITHPSLEALALPCARSLEDRGLEVVRIEVPEGERSKSLGCAERVLRQMARAGAHRGDLVVAFGGGVICDLAGYVASTYHRGIAVAHVPTTLLAQVDAAIGGKTSVNLPEGKNLVGTIHQPIFVVCDIDLLAGLARAELASGMAEVVKYGLILRPELLRLVEDRAPDILAAEPGALQDVVTRSVGIKAAIVAADEREHGRRALLNYGHTFAHAIERVRTYGVTRHGEAVALGMMAAAHLAAELGRIDEPVVVAHRRALEAVGLPTSARLDFEALAAAWRQDKKYRRGVRFVLLEKLGKAESGIVAGEDSVRRAVERLAS